MSNKVLLTLAVLGCGVLCSPLWAQSQVNVVKIFTSPPGLIFRVDGQPFAGSADFAWPANSKHEVFAYEEDNNNHVGERYGAPCWLTNLSEVCSNIQPITAIPL